MKKVGLIGVGAIGKGLLKNLIKNNCEVIAFDISEKSKEEIRNLGGIVASHPKEVVQFAKVIFLSLPSPQIIKELFQGEDGIAGELMPDTSILDLSTIDPGTTREMAALCKRYYSYYFDCPVSGGPTGADQGTLTIMTGGPKEQYDKIEEYLHYVGSNIKYIGESGMAQVMKLCHNVIGAVNIAAAGEALATGVKYGLNAKVILDVVAKSMGSNGTLLYFGPNVVNNTYENVKFMLNHMHKDVGLYITMAQQSGVPSLIATNTYNLYHTAKIQNKGHLDHSAVCQVFEEMGNVKINSNNDIIVEQAKVPETFKPEKKIGLIGVGAIGKGVLKNLLKHDCEVMAYDISEKGKDEIRRLGGLVANHPKEVAQFADIIFLSLPGPRIIKELFLGKDGIESASLSNKTILDLSPIDPGTTKEMADVCSQYKSYYFDCPVSGGPAGADEGTLTIMVGGPKHQYDKIVGYLHLVGENIEYIGEIGLAQALKLCHNMLGAANIVALGEAFATGVKQGLRIDVMAEVIRKGLSNSRSLEYFGPNIINNTYENAKFMLNHMHKDLRLYVKMTQQIGVPSFIGANVYALYEAAKSQDKGHLDHTSVCQVIENLASVKLVADVTATIN